MKKVVTRLLFYFSERLFQFYRGSSLKAHGYQEFNRDAITSHLSLSKKPRIHILGSGETMPSTFNRYFHKGDKVIGLNFSFMFYENSDIHFLELYSNYSRFSLINSILNDSVISSRLAKNMDSLVVLKNLGHWYNNRFYNFISTFPNSMFLREITLKKNLKLIDVNKFITDDRFLQAEGTLSLIVSLFKNYDGEILFHGCSGEGRFFYEIPGNYKDHYSGYVDDLIKYRQENASTHITNKERYFFDFIKSLLNKTNIKYKFV